MKLKIYTPENTGSIRQTGNKISFNRKSGVISLSRELIETLDFKDDDKIIIAQDELKTKDWYIKKSLNGGFAIRHNKKGLLHVFNNTCISNKILSSIDIKGNSGSFMVAHEPTIIDQESYLAIITSKPYVRGK